MARGGATAGGGGTAARGGRTAVPGGNTTAGAARFTTRDVADLTGLSTHTVNYLYRTGIVTPAMTGQDPSGRGRARRYGFADLVLLATYAALLERGVSVKRLDNAEAAWRGYFAAGPGQPPPQFLVTQGERLAFVGARDLARTLSAPAATPFAFVVDLAALRERLRTRLGAGGTFGGRRRTGPS